MNGSISATVAKADAGGTAGNEAAIKCPAGVFQIESGVSRIDDTFNCTPGRIAEIKGGGIQSDDGKCLNLIRLNYSREPMIRFYSQYSVFCLCR